MQAFDALTLKAVAQEAAPILLNSRVDDFCQLGRDEIILTFRGRYEAASFRLSAHAQYGHLGLIKPSFQPIDKGGEIRSNFSQVLKRALRGATLVGLVQPNKDRILDLIFSCPDEVGSLSHKILTTEIMGRHSNIIFWDKTSANIIAFSHAVTESMSRHRQILPGAKYIRPPGLGKPNILSVKFEDFVTLWATTTASVFESNLPVYAALGNWFLTMYSGISKQLAFELSRATSVHLAEKIDRSQASADAIWPIISKIQNDCHFRPAMRRDLLSYTLFDLNNESADTSRWKKLPTANDLVEEFYAENAAAESMRHLQEQLVREKLSAIAKLESRLTACVKSSPGSRKLTDGKLFGDLILANLHEIKSGQDNLVCLNVFSELNEEVAIVLSPNMTAAQNAQIYYRQFAKDKTREQAIQQARLEAEKTLTILKADLGRIEKSRSYEELKEMKQESQVGQQAMKRQGKTAPKNGKNKRRLMTLNSSDGWTIYVGRNRLENDQLLRHLACDRDIWLHVLGRTGAHVLIRVPSSKEEPPLTTLKEAAYVAARFSKVTVGTIVRVLYTHVRYVNRAPKAEAGVVQYEREKTLEVDTGVPMPKINMQLFDQ